MTLQRLVLTFKPEGVEIRTLYRRKGGSNAGTKARSREITALAKAGLQNALEALECGDRMPAQGRGRSRQVQEGKDFVKATFPACHQTAPPDGIMAGAAVGLCDDVSQSGRMCGINNHRDEEKGRTDKRQQKECDRRPNELREAWHRMVLHASARAAILSSVAAPLFLVKILRGAA